MSLRNSFGLGASLGDAAMLEKSLLFSELPYNKREFVVRALATEMVLLLRTCLSFSELPHSKREV